MWNALIVAFVLAAAIADVKSRRIPRALTTAGLLGGLVFHGIHGGFFHFEFFSAALAASLGLAAGLFFFQMGAIGGGDVKLIAALGALMGLSHWLTAMEVAVLAAGAIALVQVLRRRAFLQTVHNMKALASGLKNTGLAEHPIINVRNKTMIRAPFGVAAALGTIVAVLV